MAAVSTTTRKTVRPRTHRRGPEAPVPGPPDGMFAGYLNPDRPNAGAFDEMFAPDGSVRPAARALHSALTSAGGVGLAARSEAVDRAYTDRGITFSLSGEERPIPLDPVPRIIGANEWRRLERGLIQRVRALEMFLADVYGAQEILRDRVLPRGLVSSCANFRREVAGLQPPTGVRIHVAGIDIIRDDAGVFRVLEDNLRCPSGVSYVIENRRTMARVFPDLFTRHRVAPVQDYAALLLRALRAAAPDSPDPTVVVLTPGVYNSAYFEHSLLARQMGVELVEGRDLLVRDDALYMRTTSGEHRVDVVYRRIDDDFLDPLQFHPESVLGVAGLLNAARAGNVVIANAVGTGVGDDKLVYTYVPDMIRYYLGEQVLLPNVETIRCWLPEEREYALDHADSLVFKPVEGSGGYGIVFGRDCSERELAAVRRRVRAHPRGWIAQPVIQLSTVPTWVDGKLVPRHVDLRPFVVDDGETISVLSGGLTRVALREGNLVVNSSQGGGGKDTWVLAGRREVREDGGTPLLGDTARGRRRRRVRAGADHGPAAAAAAAAATATTTRTAAAAGTVRTADGVRPWRSRRVTAVMLARNAASVYWIGRYVERADDIARILDTSVHHLLSDGTSEPVVESRTLLRVLGTPAPAEVRHLLELTEWVAWSEQNAGSIASSLRRARENARGSREIVSTEMWECLNTTTLAISSRAATARATGFGSFLAWVEQQAAMFAGLADSSMRRDESWLFLVLGRSLERVDMVVRLLMARAQDPASSPGWLTVLRSVGAGDLFTRTFGGTVDANRVVRLLLLDRLFPRSVFHALRVAETCITQLDANPGEAGRLLGRARSDLEYLRPDIASEDLAVRLAGLQHSVREANEAIAVQFFHAAPWVAWTAASELSVQPEEHAAASSSAPQHPPAEDPILREFATANDPDAPHPPARRAARSSARSSATASATASTTPSATAAAAGDRAKLPGVAR